MTREKRKARSIKKVRTPRSSSVARIPKDLAAAIKQCWPRRVVEEFSVDESYFDEIRDHIERDLRNISGTSLVWQTEGAGDASWDERSECKRASAQPSRDDDNPEESPLQDFEWQSYHVFFVSPNGEEFRFEAETIGDDPEDGAETTVRGDGRYGLALAISLAAPFAVINASSYSWFEDGSIASPDPVSNFFWNDVTGEALAADEYYRDVFSREMSKKLEVLRQKFVSILAHHRIFVLEESVLDLPLKGLKADPDVFLEKPLCVRDAFFFRGV